MSDVVDAVAQAIFDADPENDGYIRSRTWCGVHPSFQDNYRAMARAAIDALELTEQWGWQLGEFTPNAYDSEREARERVAELDAMFAADPDSKRHSSLKRHIVSRLVSPWVRKDNTNE